MVVIVILTLVLGYFSFQTQFDANMGHINYMTDEQKADMAYLQCKMTQNGDYQKVYVISSDSTLDGALDKSLRLQPHLNGLQQKRNIHDFQVVATLLFRRLSRNDDCNFGNTSWSVIRRKLSLP